MKSVRRRWALGTLIALVAFVALVIVFHDAVLTAVIPPLARLAGFDVRLRDLHLGAHELRVADVDVRNLHGEEIATIDRASVGFDARDLLPGGKTLFGLRSIDVERPRLTLIHHRDGTYNIPLPHGSTQSSGGPLAPLDATIHVADGSATIVDDGRLYRESRRLGVERLDVDGVFRPAAPSNYDVSFAIVEGGRSYPVAGHGYFDDARGIENNRIRAAEIPIGPLVDYALNTSVVHITSGSLRDLDARYYGIPDHRGTIVRRLGVAGRLADFTLQLGFLAKPLRDGSGPVYAYDDGLAIPRLTGTVAEVPVTVSGAIYDFAKPTFRLGVMGDGALARLVTLSDAAKKFAVGGSARFGLLVVGDATAPLTFARFSSPRITYERYPFDRVHGLVAIFGTDTTVLDAGLGYAGSTVATRGNLSVRKHTGVDFVAGIDAPTKTLPYADALLPGMTIAAQAIASGTDAKLETAGVVSGATEAQSLDGLFRLAPAGTGFAGPLTLTGPGGESFYVDAAIDRPRGSVDGLLDARGLRLTNTRVTSFPGVADLPALPPFALALDASLGASLRGKRVVAAGSAAVRDATLRGVPLGAVTVDGAAASDGDLASTRLTARGEYAGRLDDLARLAPGTTSATGDIGLAFGAISSGGGTVAELHDRGFENVRVDGIGIDGLDATVGVHGGRLDVYEARADLTPGSIVASGSLGNGGTIRLATSPIDLTKLGTLGRTLPVSGGTVSAVASAGGTPASPTLDAGVVASDIRYRQYVLGGSTSLRYGDGRLSIARGLFDLAGAVTDVDGTVDGLRPGAIRPRLDVDADAESVEIGTLVALAHAPLPPTAGSLDASVHVTGPASAPAVSGAIRVPYGSINGLDFRAASLAFAGSARGVTTRDGSVTVGTTRVRFGATASAASQRLTLAAPHLDLADFDDYFDAADTLAGSGSLSLAVSHDADHLATTGSLALTGVQVRRIPVGTTDLVLATRGRTISVDAHAGDTRGVLSLAGGVTLPATDLQRDTLRRTNLALTAKANAIDLERWLPVVGVQAPVAGLAQATLRVDGTYPRLGVAATAGLEGGRIGRIPVTQAALTATARQGGRVTVTSATFDIPNLSTSLSGSAGLRPTDPVDLTLRSTTDDVGALAKTVTAQTLDVSGSAQVALTLGGTPQRPALAASLDADRLRYAKYTVPHAHAEVAVADLARDYQSGRVDLRNTSVDLVKGRITAAGSAPFEVAPAPGLGPENAPVALTLGVQAVDLGQFGALMPKNTKLGGMLAGTLGLADTVGDPAGTGELALTNLSFIGPAEAQKITNGSGTIALSGHTIALRDAKVEAGGGTIGATGRATVADLHDPAGSTTYEASATFAHPTLKLPNIYNGKLDGTLSVAKNTVDATPRLSGDITASDARIPYTALLPPQATGTPGPPPPPVDLALGVTVGQNVRVQSGPVDIGARGHLDVGGTVASPNASGKIVSTGGTINFYRNFTLQRGTVAFSPDEGVIPTVDAEATTQIASPATSVTLDVTGLATQLNVALTSDPEYSKTQILGLLVGLNNYGAVAGVPASAGGPAPTAGSLAQNFATGQVATLFQQQLLEPLTAGLGGATGANIGVNYSPGGLNVNVSRKIFKNVNAVFAETFNYPQRTSYGIEATNPSGTTALQITLFQQNASNQFDIAPQALFSTNQSVTAAEPQNGQNGFSASLQRRF